MKGILLTSVVLAAFFASCESDNSSSFADNQIITHFVVNNYQANGDGPEVVSVMDYTVTDNKYDSYTHETFVNGVSSGIENYVDYEYENGLLVLHNDGISTRHFFYDAQGKLIGADRIFENGGALHYRFGHHPGNIVFCERLNAPYNDPSAVISQRYIMDFDDDDNIISAGRDTNLDGEMELPNIFTTADGDISAIAFGNGTLATYDYADIVNNVHFLNENSYGKQVQRLMCSETYGGLNQDQLGNVLFSRHLFESEIPLAIYEVNGNNNFIKKKTLEEPNGNHTVTEYFFE